MMTNREIAKTFQLLAKMMELHGENEFRIRAYRNAYDALKRLDQPVSGMSVEEIGAIKGIGPSTAEKIHELLTKGSMERFDQYAKKTPEGIREMLMIKGLGAGKVKSIWKQMGIETPGELLYACNENRLIEFSGFGLKTQTEIREQLEYHLESSGKYLWAAIGHIAEGIVAALKTATSGKIEWVGEYRRKSPVVHHLECIVEGKLTAKEINACRDIEVVNTTAPFRCIYQDIYPFTVHWAPAKDLDKTLLSLTATDDFLKAFGKKTVPDDFPPELMESATGAKVKYKDLVTTEDIAGIIHCHSTYSDGLHTLKEMAEYAKEEGFQYLGITDHSKTAVYAKGLTTERVEAQWKEIDMLNAAMAGKTFRIFKGIESDILGDGSLDYPDEVLAGFDFVIASIHGALKMDVTKATTRLIKAIENPYTRILGHPTGRLLLARQGYPIDHEKVIDACARNGVAIELNANPQRLDMDSGYIPYALEQGVLISINPDAHSRESIHNVRFGVDAARRGGLPAKACLTAKPLKEFAAWVETKR